MRSRRLVTIGMVALLTTTTHAGQRTAPDHALRQRLAHAGITPLDLGPTPPPAKVRLGQLLFFDKVLGGNRDTACATCHHPTFHTADALPLSIGTGGLGLGPTRVPRPGRPLVPRNATDLFNRGAPQWTTMFWDVRVTTDAGQLQTPAGARLPDGLDGVLAAQAMFPVTGRDEMRGYPGDPGNELAPLANDDFPGIWDALMDRLWAIPAYRHLFANAYPDVPPARLGFQHAANAIAAFETVAFAANDTPWDRYLAGADHALSPAAHRGARLFYGRAGCVHCHAGPLLTDQRPHNLAVPQLGPGKAPNAPLDLGCAPITGRPADRFTFRTPPLRNVALTGPWMHNGAYATLASAVRHHLHPVWSLLTYDRTQLPPALRLTVRDDPATLRALLSTLDPRLRRPVPLRERDLADLLAFLHALTSPSAATLDRFIPPAVPSGLPVDRLPPRW